MEDLRVCLTGNSQLEFWHQVPAITEACGAQYPSSGAPPAGSPWGEAPPTHNFSHPSLDPVGGDGQVQRARGTYTQDSLSASVEGESLWRFRRNPSAHLCLCSLLPGDRTGKDLALAPFV